MPGQPNLLYPSRHQHYHRHHHRPKMASLQLLRLQSPHRLLSVQRERLQQLRRLLSAAPGQYRPGLLVASWKENHSLSI